MGTHDDVYLARLEVSQDLARLLRGAGTAEVIHTYGEVAKTVGESVEVLVGEDGGGHHDGRLLAVHGGLEGGSHGDFGLAEAHVAADKSVHGSGAFHVGLDVLRGLELVGCVLVEETGFEFVLEVRVGAIGKTFLLAAAAVEADEVAGDVLDFRFRALLHALPGTGTKTADARRLALLALVLRDLVQGVDGDIDDVIVLVDNLDHLLHGRGGGRGGNGSGAVDGHADEASEAADAVIHMDDVVAHFKLLQFLQRESHLSRTSTVAAEVVFVEAVEDLMVCEEADLQVVVGEACVQSLVNWDEMQLRRLLLEDGSQAVGLLPRICQNVDGVALGEVVLEGVGDEVEVLVEDGLRSGGERERLFTRTRPAGTHHSAFLAHCY